jgi:hypothetical protein
LPVLVINLPGMNVAFESPILVIDPTVFDALFEAPFLSKTNSSTEPITGNKSASMKMNVGNVRVLAIPLTFPFPSDKYGID